MIATQVLQVKGALDLLDKFTAIARRGLSGQGLVLPHEVAAAGRLATEAAAWRDAAAEFSGRFQGESFRLLGAAADPATAGRTAGGLSERVDQLTSSRWELPARIAKVEDALAAVRAKHRAAVAILESPSASGAIAAATQGTGELAELFAASVDLERIENSLDNTLTALRAVDSTVSADIAFGTAWSDALFGTCVRGGVCSQTTLEIPFVGTSRLRFLPGEEGP
ncbi:hypothetical protein AB0C76_14915 [Kitasatospora sp. NPDC048722]|uniref:hypothetical protein n=1 Tax=Kitasatospora sp. NPDC048722 TaxID=3155639 RepID=UPI0033F0DD92